MDALYEIKVKQHDNHRRDPAQRVELKHPWRVVQRAHNCGMGQIGPFRFFANVTLAPSLKDCAISDFRCDPAGHVLSGQKRFGVRSAHAANKDAADFSRINRALLVRG